MGYLIPPEFQKLTEAEVEKALADKRDNRVIQELARLLDTYAGQCSRLVRDGKNPEIILKQKPGCALEKLALQMTADAVRAELAKKGR
jgi:hypothetical protein